MVSCGMSALIPTRCRAMMPGRRIVAVATIHTTQVSTFSTVAISVISPVTRVVAVTVPREARRKAGGASAARVVNAWDSAPTSARRRTVPILAVSASATESFIVPIMSALPTAMSSKTTIRANPRRFAMVVTIGYEA